jgi:cytochrome c peroxidase
MVYQLIRSDQDFSESYSQLFGALPSVSSLLVGVNYDNVEKIWQSMNSGDHESITLVAVNAVKTIAAFERTIISHDAPFDGFVRSLSHSNGDRSEQGISASAQRGLKLFIGRANCVTCHYGPLFSDGEFHNLQLPEVGLEPPGDPGRYQGISVLVVSPMNKQGSFADRSEATVPPDRDLRFLSAKPEFWGQFKTPSLRNLRRRGRFMHNGVFGSLDDVVEFYSTLRRQTQSGHHDEQVLKPLNLSPDEKRDLLAFLDTLNDY